MSELRTEFAGERGDLFALALKTGFLTVISAGIYRFWQTTRLRRWYWSAIRPGGIGLEYTGSPYEKLMGFMVAMVVLAVYIALFNMLGIWLAIQTAEQIGQTELLLFGIAIVPLTALVPLIFAARYRSRRYILSRTRWMGIRFGMDRGAWGYAWRACMYWLLTLLTLGLLWPLKNFQLEKYLTDRTWFGTARFSQHGHAGHLIGVAMPFYIGLYGTIGIFVAMVMTEDPGWAWLLFISIPMFLLGMAYFRVASMRVMAGLKELGDGLEFDFSPRTRRLLWIWLWGNFLTSFMVGLVSPVLLGLVVGLLYVLGLVEADAILNTPPNVAAFLGVATWLTVLVLYSTFRQALVVYPSARHIAETVVIDEPMLLRSIRQRDRATDTDAGGFAEALDVGAAF